MIMRIVVKDNANSYITANVCGNKKTIIMATEKILIIILMILIIMIVVTILMINIGNNNDKS